MTISRDEKLLLNKQKIRNKISGTLDCPRVTVFRSLKHIYAQAVDDDGGKTLATASTTSQELKGKLEKVKKMDQAKKVGELLAKKLIEKNINKIVFDRSGRKYHGRIKALAESARTAGLKF
ncbi:MAG: 50S ribosomal protein L18 [Elusimicrobia bacterium RIFOXYA2_FULL_40_6]|nr:MAG: 50S ribosomal protein L18 [Elusimicrobia bacterium RIFOXYA2_FULL_40_6]